jgi:hypothetical protein
MPNTNFILTAHIIADERRRIIQDAKNLRDRIAAFKETITSIPAEYRENIRMILLADGIKIADLSALFNSLDAGLSNAPVDP